MAGSWFADLRYERKHKHVADQITNLENLTLCTKKNQALVKPGQMVPGAGFEPAWPETTTF